MSDQQIMIVDKLLLEVALDIREELQGIRADLRRVDDTVTKIEMAQFENKGQALLKNLSNRDKS